MKIKSARLLVMMLCLSLSYSVNSAIPNVTAQGKPFPSLAPMLKKVNSAVVNIATYSTKQALVNPLLNDPFFRHFFDIPEQGNLQQKAPQKRQKSAGSGVIINAQDGIVMTNYHVIKDADEVQVSLIDGRSYKAKIIGSDPELDIAILSIKAKKLTQVTISESILLEVGDFVVAIGNPFGLGQTVTTGIVSALGRSGLGIEGYENFIQTDASINPGNSGGALVNLNGELVGINTAIIAPAGGNIGIGFAIPINMAEASMQKIIKYGEVKRGQIGVSIQDITRDLSEALGLENGQLGVLVAGVTKGSPAEKAGLIPGDIITGVDGQLTKSTGQLRSQIGLKSIGDTVKVTLLHNGIKKTVDVGIGKPQTLSTADSSGELHPLLEGVSFANNNKGQGVKVTEVQANSPAAYSGLEEGDLIIATNKHSVDDLLSFKKALGLAKNSILLQVNRNGMSLFIAIR
ncbi:protease Do [Psychromonas ingrahamii 37]|uniref:Protease Do n=1 Tax=Psychromonas ingrahamii (strain DSM 17664 / CCUG 51855 / 37) TaxID=357804 RepID=A1STR1_PSYIN|nr:Do family serine endopeptidase [Psychromonas ingrahamii]ABM02876.1 protease Do [Psychromonas ingrahamii 37]